MSGGPQPAPLARVPAQERRARRALSRIWNAIPRWAWPLGLVAVGAAIAGGPEVAALALVVPPFVLATRTRDAVTLLSAYVVLLFVIPSRLIIGPLGASGTPANLVGLAALVWWVLARLVPGLGVARGMQPVRIALLLFWMAFTISYAMAYLHLTAGIEISAANRAVAFVAAMGGVALLAADGIATRERLDTLLRRLVAATTFMATIGIIQFATGSDISRFFSLPGLTPNFSFGDVSQRSIFNRVQATAIHPIEFGVVLALVLPIAFHYALSAPRGRRGVPTTCAAVIAFALPTSVSRAAILALVATCAVLLAGWSWKRRRQALTVGVFFLAAVRLLVPGLLGTIRSLFTNILNDPSTTGRTDDYAVVGRYIAESPAFGRGMFTFIPSRYTTLDNQYLLTVIEMGFVGLAVLILLYLVGVFTARGARRRAGDPDTQQLAQALAAAMFAAMLTAATFDQLSFPMVVGVFSLMLGCAGCLWRLTGGPGARGDTPPPTAYGSARRDAAVSALDGAGGHG